MKIDDASLAKTKTKQTPKKVKHQRVNIGSFFFWFLIFIDLSQKTIYKKWKIKENKYHPM